MPCALFNFSCHTKKTEHVAMTSRMYVRRCVGKRTQWSVRRSAASPTGCGASTRVVAATWSSRWCDSCRSTPVKNTRAAHLQLPLCALRSLINTSLLLVHHTQKVEICTHKTSQKCVVIWLWRCVYVCRSSGGDRGGADAAAGRGAAPHWGAALPHAAPVSRCC